MGRGLRAPLRRLGGQNGAGYIHNLPHPDIRFRWAVAAISLRVLLMLRSLL